MSIAAIVKADQKKLIDSAMAEFLSKGGKVRRVPTPTFYSENIRWANTYAQKKNKSKMQIAITASIARTNAEKGAAK